MKPLLPWICLLLALTGCRSAMRQVMPIEALRVKAQTLLAVSEVRGSHQPQVSPRVGPTAEAYCATQQMSQSQLECARWLVRQEDPAKIRAGISHALAESPDTEPVQARLLEASYGLGRLVERAPKDQRDALSSLAVDVAQPCSLSPVTDALCDYRLAQALGIQARERRATAVDALPRIIALLEQTLSKDAALDHAGADRTLAWLYVRAPGWPTGPGDPDLGLEHAQAAVERAPDYPPNHMALGECLQAVDQPDEAAEAYNRALDLIDRLAPDTPDRKNWEDDTNRRLERLK